MKEKNNGKYKKVGAPPGSLEYIGDKKDIGTEVTIIDYSKDDYSIKKVDDIDKTLSEVKKGYVRWIIVDGVGNVPVIEQIGKEFDLHPLVLEDILNPNQVPKFEDYKDFVFIVLKKLTWDKNKESFESEQISFILEENVVITFREQKSNIFNSIKDRITIPKGILRKMEADYLVYSLIDVVIDNYFILQERIEERIEKLEEELIQNPKLETLQSIYSLKRDIIDFRKSIWPLREVVNRFQREESPLITDAIHVYIRDLYDHIFKINDSIQTYRDIVSGLLEMYLSSVSNKMNDIMKVLTIISTIFIPLSFLAGLYGMNFAFMPELSSPLGYPVLIVIMFSIGIGMLAFFKRKKWI